MKYYSEKTQKIYNSEKELLAAEEKLNKQELEAEAKRKERSKRAKEVEDAYNKYQELLKKFINDYGSYHTTISNPISIFDLINFF